MAEISGILGYVRVSTEEQADSGAGLDAQADAIRRYSEGAGIPLLGIERDEGVCGALPPDARPGLARALSQLGSGMVLCVSKRDRLARDVVSVAVIEQAVRRAGAVIYSVAGEGNGPDTPENVLIRRIMDSFAEYERLLIVMRTRAAFAALKRKGRKFGRAPFGWRRVGDTILPVPGEQAIFVMIGNLHASGMSLRDIAAELEHRRVAPPRRSRAWHPQAVKDILMGPSRVNWPAP